MKCANCGNTIKEAHKFCPFCGELLISDFLIKEEVNHYENEMTYDGSYDDDFFDFSESQTTETDHTEIGSETGFHYLNPTGQSAWNHPENNVDSNDVKTRLDSELTFTKLSDHPDHTSTESEVFHNQDSSILEESFNSIDSMRGDHNGEESIPDEPFHKPLDSDDQKLLPSEKPDDRKRRVIIIAIVSIIIVTLSMLFILHGRNSTGNTNHQNGGTVTNSENSDNHHDTSETEYSSSHKSAESISDSWDEIISSVQDGSYADKYRIGDIKELDLGPEGIIEMQIAAFDMDELEDGSGKAAITWISKQLLESNHCMNSPKIKELDDSYDYQKDAGAILGWEYSEMRLWLKEYVKPLIPATVQNAIRPVVKYSIIRDASDKTINNVISIDDIWIPSYREVYGSQQCETEGVVYTDLFKTDKDRAKNKTEKSDTESWWLRSVFNDNFYYSVYYYGNSNSYQADRKSGIAFGFCM